MTLKLNGSTSGSVSIDAPASTAGGADRTLTLPDDAGNGVIKTSTYPSSHQVLEQFFSPCDGSVIALQDGDHTLANVSSIQELTTSYVDVTGSSISYTPPTGTKQVIYEFYAMHGPGDQWNIPHFKLFLDSDEVVYQRKTITANDYADLEWGYKYAFNIGGSANTNTGRVASWTSAKTIKIQVREYSSNYESVIHHFQHWDGSGGGTFHQPSIGITAIGAA